MTCVSLINVASEYEYAFRTMHFVCAIFVVATKAAIESLVQLQSWRQNHLSETQL